MTAWATTSDVLELTGKAVTGAQIGQAQAVVDLFSGVPSTTTAVVSDRDRRLLKLALCWQTAFMVEQVDVTSRMNVSSLSQDGASFTTASPDAMVLSPLTERALNELSWRQGGVGAIDLAPGQKPYRNVEEWAAAWLRDECPADTGGWRPL